uniref:uncharacterized protein LOC122596941 n=1 Tax=Erigeron canadensis TaxID=72917 RepID=UPI001CB9A13D|nr:uncharacterized protein LOC122596941 [Erigeron canadensis]
MVNTRANSQLDGATASDTPANRNGAGNAANQRPPRRPYPGEVPTRSEIERVNPVIEQIPTQAEMYEELRAIRAKLIRTEEELVRVRAEREVDPHREEHTDGNYSNRSNRAEPSIVRSQVAPMNDVVGVQNEGVVNRVVVAPRATNFKYESFQKCSAKDFDGTQDVVGAMEWLDDIEVVFVSCYCPEDMKVLCASCMLKKNARNWWRSTTVSLTPEVLAAMPWGTFRDKFLEEYVGTRELRLIEKEFRALTAKFVGHMVRREIDQVEATVMVFLLAIMAYVGNILLCQLLSKNPRDLMMISKLRRLLRRSLTGNLGSREGMMIVWGLQRSGRIRRSRAKHHGNYSTATQKCLRCGEIGHASADCKNEVKCFNCNKKGHISTSCPDRAAEPKKNDKKTNSRAFQMTAEDARGNDDVVNDTFLVNSIPASVLFDSGANRTFVSTSFGSKLGIPISRLGSIIEVEIPDGKLITIREIYRNCSIDIEGNSFPVHLLPTTRAGFDVVLGMDWLGKFNAEILCKRKIVHLVAPNGDVVRVYGEKQKGELGIVSMMKALKYIRQTKEHFLAYVIDSREKMSSVSDIDVESDFPEVFSRGSSRYFTRP